MDAVDREQLRSACADALEALTRDQRVDGLVRIADSLRALGPPYRFHGELMHGALRDGQDNAITWHLISRTRAAREGGSLVMRTWAARREEAPGAEAISAREGRP